MPSVEKKRRQIGRLCKRADQLDQRYFAVFAEFMANLGELSAEAIDLQCATLVEIAIKYLEILDKFPIGYQLPPEKLRLKVFLNSEIVAHKAIQKIVGVNADEEKKLFVMRKAWKYQIVMLFKQKAPSFTNVQENRLNKILDDLWQISLNLPTYVRQNGAAEKASASIVQNFTNNLIMMFFTIEVADILTSLGLPSWLTFLIAGGTRLGVLLEPLFLVLYNMTGSYTQYFLSKNVSSDLATQSLKDTLNDISMFEKMLAEKGIHRSIKYLEQGIERCKQEIAKATGKSLACRVAFFGAANAVVHKAITSAVAGNIEALTVFGFTASVLNYLRVPLGFLNEILYPSAKLEHPLYKYLPEAAQQVQQALMHP